MIIELLNGDTLDTSDYNLKRLFHRIPSLNVENQFVSVDDRYDILTNSKFNNRVISVDFLYEVYDIYDFYLLRDELNNLFVRDEEFYIIFKREPYKKWKVKLGSQFNIEPSPNMQTFTIDFVTVQGYAESIYSSLEIIKTWDIGQHAWNGVIDFDSPVPVYSYFSNSFNVKNLGNKKIDPRTDFFNMRITGSFDSSVKVTNLTTGDIYLYNKGLPSTGLLNLNGIRTIRDGVSDFGSTNKKILTLAPGDNEILVEGGTVNNITVDFKFLYK